MPKKILVTGCSGYLGEVLVKNLLTHPIVARVIAVDIKTPKLKPHPKFKHHPADIRDEYLLRSLLEEESIDTIFHLAFMTNDPQGTAMSRAVNVEGTMTVLDAANKTPSVRKLIVTSSALAYGARRKAPEFLTEDIPLKTAALPYARHKKQVEEEIARTLPQLRKDLQVAVLRVCTVVGSSEREEGPVSRFLRKPFSVSVLFRRGALQFLAEDDLMMVLIRIMETPDFRGTFNVAPDDYTTIAALCRRFKKRRIPVPYMILWLLQLLARHMQLPNPLDERILNYLAHPAVLCNRKLKKKLGITFDTTSEEAFLACASKLAFPHGSAKRTAAKP